MASPLSNAHILAQERLRALTGQTVRAVWTGLPGYDEANVDQFLTTTVPVVRAAQRQSAALTDAYVSRAMKRRPVGVNPDDVTGATVRAGTPPEEVYRRPFVTVWTALAAGTEYPRAVDAGGQRATSTAEMDVQLASRATYGAIQRVESRIRGWERVADGGACPYCQKVNGAFVKSAYAMGLHPRCGCGLDPVFTTVTVTPLPDTVAVHQHGELGALIGAAGDHFTQL